MSVYQYQVTRLPGLYNSSLVVRGEYMVILGLFFVVCISGDFYQVSTTRRKYVNVYFIKRQAKNANKNKRLV